MTTSEWIALFAAVAATGSAIAAFLSWRTSHIQLKVLKRQSFNVAAEGFRNHFIDVQYRLRQNLAKNDTDVYLIINDSTLAPQAQTKIAFEPYLAANERASFDAAWDAYANAIRSPKPGNVDQRRFDTNAALAQIEAVLDFARPK